MKKIILLFSLLLSTTAFAAISYQEFKSEHFPDPELDQLVAAIIKVINENTRNGGAVVWYDPQKPKEIFSRTGKSILIGFWLKPIIDPDNCITDLENREYRCTDVQDKLVLERVPTHIVTAQKTIFLTETLAQIKIAGGNPDKWYPFITALSEAAKDNIVEIDELGFFKIHKSDGPFDFQFSQEGWREEKPLLVPGYER